MLLLAFPVLSQDKKDLQAKKKKLQEEIEYTNKLIQETKKDKKLTLDQLLKLKSKINAREQLIANINQQIELTQQQIEENEDIIASLEKDLENLKEEYSKLIYYAWKNKDAYNRIMFIFAAEDFNQAYKRLKYFQQYSEYRKQQARLIVKTKEEINNKVKEMEQTVKDKRALLGLKQEEKENLSSEKSEQETAVTKLQKQEKELKKELKEKQEAARKLQKAIEKIIKEEIRKAKEAARKAGKSSKGYPLTPEAKKLSASFASNKGKLPWPVEQGVITSRYGEHNHPVLKGVKVNNNGMDISTTKGSAARAIFSGEVSAVVIIPGEGKAVFVRHGEYLSVYSYLSQVFVTKGDMVNTKQDLGMLVTDNSKAKTAIHLEIWKGTTKLNPEYWIYRK